MQFELLKAQVAKAAATAKGFKGFDEMAENDDYLKTNSLNVVRRQDSRNGRVKTNTFENQTNTQPCFSDESFHEEHSSLSTHRSGSSTKTPLSMENNSITRTQSKKLLTKQKAASNSSLSDLSKDDVARALDSSVTKKGNVEVKEKINENTEKIPTDPKINLPDDFFLPQTKEWSILDKMLSPNAPNSKNKRPKNQQKASKTMEINRNVMDGDVTKSKSPEKVVASDYSVFSRLEELMQNAEVATNIAPIDNGTSEEEHHPFGNHFDSDEEQDDIVLKMMKQAHEEKRDTSRKKYSNKETNEVKDSTLTLTEEKIVQDPNLMSPKDPNRFFTDLESRLCTTPKDDDDDLTQHESDYESAHKEETSLSIIGSFAAADNKLAWLQKVTAPGISFVAKKISSKHGSEMETLNPRSGVNDFRRNANKDQTYIDEYDRDLDNGAVVASSDLLRSEEKAELERLNRNANSGVLSILHQYLVQHKNFAFLFFTLLLMTLVYFYTRKKMINDVT